MGNNNTMLDGVAYFVGEINKFFCLSMTNVYVYMIFYLSMFLKGLFAKLSVFLRESFVVSTLVLSERSFPGPNIFDYILHNLR